MYVSPEYVPIKQEQTETVFSLGLSLYTLDGYGNAVWVTDSSYNEEAM